MLCIIHFLNPQLFPQVTCKYEIRNWRFRCLQICDRSTYAELFIGFFRESEALVGFGGEKYHVYDSSCFV